MVAILEALQPGAHREDLPGGEDVAGGAQLVDGFVDHPTVGVAGMVAGEEDAVSLRHGGADGLQPVDLDLQDAIAAALCAATEGAPDVHPETAGERGPPARGLAQGVAIHERWSLRR